MQFKLDDKNSAYLGDGAYGHIDEYGRTWVIASNGVFVTEQICLEDGAIESLIRLQNRVRDEEKCSS